MIKFLSHKEIDYCKWDATINSSSLCLPYAYSWWLDAFASSWDALVMNDYEYVMPLPNNLRCGFLRQGCVPYYTQQLGIFSALPVTERVMKAFIKAIPFSLYTYYLNEEMPRMIDRRVSDRVNYTIDLSLPKQQIFDGYSTNAKRNIAKAKRCDLCVQPISVSELADFYFSHNAHNCLNKENLLEVFQLIDRHQMFCAYGVKSGSQLCAVAGFISCRGRLIYLFPASNGEGKRVCAMFFLIDFLLNNHSSHIHTLDFEGSMIPSVARFYLSFGAKKNTYQEISSPLKVCLSKIKKRLKF